MDGENNGKPYFLMDDLGENPLFPETSILVLTKLLFLAKILYSASLGKYADTASVADVDLFSHRSGGQRLNVLAKRLMGDTPNTSYTTSIQYDIFHQTLHHDFIFFVPCKGGWVENRWRLHLMKNAWMIWVDSGGLIPGGCVMRILGHDGRWMKSTQLTLKKSKSIAGWFHHAPLTIWLSYKRCAYCVHQQKMM